ncbi:hypothetical protein NW762_011933 [Fusarium torreyae]|uniref:Uncharacterized protein n=1 Tax=Fusarium torreyae TaxID=1237075 RepID=A0A9W8VA02_9HYPO|nr:hypothetical protein NW762_011933 [Fusarium torreyae]
MYFTIRLPSDSASTADATSAQPTAQPSFDPDSDTEDASAKRRSEAVPKRSASDQNINVGGVNRCAGGISNPNLKSATKKS